MDEDGKGISCDICVSCYTFNDAHVFAQYMLFMGDYKTMSVLAYGYCEKHVWKVVKAFHEHSLRPRAGGEWADEMLMLNIGEHHATYL